MKIRKASKEDCRAIAELAMMAGEGIPAYFWAESLQDGQDIYTIGARNAASEEDNFSYRNAHLAIENNEVAGMLLAYGLSNDDNPEDLNEYPEFIRPLIELEQCVPGSYYINMLATYPHFRNRGIGVALMGEAERLALETGCEILSVEVFEQNVGALRLYQRLGYQVVEERNVVPHDCHPYTGKIVLLTKPAV